MSFAAETTTDSDYANQRNFYKVELWTKDDQRVERRLHAGNRIDEARAVFAEAIKHRPRATPSASDAVGSSSAPNLTNQNDCCKV